MILLDALYRPGYQRLYGIAGGQRSAHGFIIGSSYTHIIHNITFKVKE